MLRLRSAATAEPQAVLDAIGRSLAIIAFDPSGIILSANEPFCDLMGYATSEIVGRHHRIFVDPVYAASPDYKAFWDKLSRGEFDVQTYKRVTKSGSEVWIQASYNPILDRQGHVRQVIKMATDVTAAKMRAIEVEAKLDAISQVQAVIEFTTDGAVINANDNFLSLLGYRLDEVVGRHHRMFVEPDYGRSPQYEQFWTDLNAGKAASASFRRFGKNGREVWIQASYNPIFDLRGRVTKIVKYANDITDLTEIGGGLARLAANNLEQAIAKPFKPTFEKLRGDFNTAHDTLSSALLEIADSTGTIASGTRQIAEAAEHLARRTEQQAASLEQTAATLDQITATVRKSADGAGQARQLVATADQSGKASAAVVGDAVDAMSEIAESSAKIGKIIGVIDEIAFQTNLLALNAGIEAARAGEAGRGFAVVASEVRALAQRSADAAKEINGLVGASSAQVQRGVRLVGETGKALQQILSHVTEINGVVADIAVGAREQSLGLQEVNTAVNQMDQLTQQNAAMVEETTASSLSLSQEATRLAALVKRFTLPSTAASMPSIAVVAAAPRPVGGPTRRPAAARAPAGALAVAVTAEAAEGGWEEF